MRIIADRRRCTSETRILRDALQRCLEYGKRLDLQAGVSVNLGNWRFDERADLNGVCDGSCNAQFEDTERNSVRLPV